jgi:RNA polymerase sigma factor (sigma-70 family)
VTRARSDLQLFTAHRTALVSYANSIVGNAAQAEDVVQDAWLKLERAKGPDPVHDPLRYLYRVVRNLAIDVRRRARRDVAHVDGTMDTVSLTRPDDTPSVEQAMIAAQELEAVMAVLAALPDQQRRAIELYRLRGCKLREISEQLGISVSYAHALIADGLALCDKARNECGRRR